MTPCGEILLKTKFEMSDVEELDSWTVDTSMIFFGVVTFDC